MEALRINLLHKYSNLLFWQNEIFSSVNIKFSYFVSQEWNFFFRKYSNSYFGRMEEPISSVNNEKGRQLNEMVALLLAHLSNETLEL
jgi:hypothetical protein